MKENLITALTGKYLRLQRMEKRLTLEKVAAETDMDSDNLGRIERGEQGPSNMTLFKLRAYINIDVNRLYAEVKKELEQQKEDGE